MPNRARRNGSVTHTGYGAGILSERVAQNERNLMSQEGELQDIRSSMATRDDIAGLAASIVTISTKLDSVGRPKWQAISVGISAIVVLGALVYWPIREKQSDQALDIQRLESVSVPRTEVQREWDRSDRWRQRTDEKLDTLQREFWMRRNGQ